MSVHLGGGMMGTKTRGSFGLYLEYRLVILLMLVLVWFVIKGRVLYAQAAPPDAGVVQVAVANLRSGPGTSYAVVGSALAGEQVQIIGCNEDCSWYQIADELWIASVLVRPLERMEDAAATSSTSTARARVAANLRAGPGTTYALIGGAAAGQRLEIVATNEDRSWYQLASGAWIAAFLVENALVVPALRAAGLIQ